jgi:hypothetical protein
MDALKESMQAKGRAKVRNAVRKRMGKPGDTQGQDPHGHDQARVGRRIDFN